jgi:hypothetical protein
MQVTIKVMNLCSPESPPFWCCMIPPAAILWLIIVRSNKQKSRFFGQVVLVLKSYIQNTISFKPDGSPEIKQKCICFQKVGILVCRIKFSCKQF